MDILIQALLLLGEPGSLFFYIFLLLILGWAVIASLIYAWRRREGPATRLAVIILSLFLARLINFSVFMLGAAGLLDPLVSSPPVARATSALTTIIILLLLAFPEPSGVADFVTVVFALLTPVAVGVAWIDWNAAVTAGATAYNGSFQETLWEITQLAFLCLGLILIAIRRRAEWQLGIGLTTILLIGHIIHYLFPLAGTNVPGAVRLAEVVAYPLLAVIIFFRVRAPAPEAELPPTRHTFIEMPAGPPDWVTRKIEDTQPMPPMMPDSAPAVTPPWAAPPPEPAPALASVPSASSAPAETATPGIFAADIVVAESDWVLPVMASTCPRLGLESDPTSRHGFASAINYCYNVQPPAEIASDHQTTYCLRADYAQCPVYTGRIKKPRLPIGDPDGSNRPAGGGVQWRRALVALLIVVLMLTSTAVLGAVMFRDQVVQFVPEIGTLIPERLILPHEGNPLTPTPLP